MGWWNNCFKDHKYFRLIFPFLEAAQAGTEPTACTQLPLHITKPTAAPWEGVTQRAQSIRL